MEKWLQVKTPQGVTDDEWKRERAQAILDDCAAIENRQCAWHELNLWNSTLFYNRELPAFRWGVNADVDNELFPADLRTENLVRSIGEAMLSRACSQPLVPSPVPHGSDYAAKLAVDRLKLFLASTWILTKAERAAVQAFLDAYVAGLGAARVVFDAGVLSVEPIFYDNVIIDNRECVNRAAPRTIRIRTVMPRASVEATYGEFPDSTYTQKKDYVNFRDVGDDWVVVVEIYRLGKGGRHSIASCGRLLVDEPWKYDWSPIVLFHWADPGSGFFCRSGVEECVPYQVKHNELNDDIKAAQDICCRPRLLSHANSNLDLNQWDNEAGRVLGYTGIEPKPLIWPTAIADLYQERERNKASCFADFGMSQMTANADLPSQVRLDSSAGVREFRNMEDSRHLRLWTDFEAFRLEIAHRMLDVLSISSGKYSVPAIDYLRSGKSDVSDAISYEDVRELKKEQYTWTLEAIPLSSMSPAARRETLAAWQAEGKIKADDDVSMIGNPDLEQIDALENASRDDVNRILGMLSRGEYESPSETTNLTYGIRACVANMQHLKTFKTGVHPKAIMLHDRWILEGIAIQQGAIQAMQPPPPPAPGYMPKQGIQGRIE